MANELNIQFSRDLGSSTELNKLLVKLNDDEIKLWENIRLYVDKRAKIDMEYAEKINKLHHICKIDTNSVNTCLGFVEKVGNSKDFCPLGLGR